jgi:nicotinamide riboside kinase
MRICLSGSHGTGKSTLLKKIANDINLEIISEVTRDLNKQGLKINEKGNDFSYTQFILFNKHLEFLFFKENFISDRGLLDVISYTYYLYKEKKVKKEIYDFIFSNIKNNINLYDKIFYFHIEFEIEDDGVRSISKNFQKNIEKIIEEFIINLNLQNVIFVRGSLEERREIVLNAIEGKF